MFWSYLGTAIENQSLNVATEHVQTLWTGNKPLSMCRHIQDKDN